MNAELLAPAGSYESMVAAVMAGADAVYMGGTRFGARAYADNPDEDNLMKALDFCHIHGVKLYMTVNTLLKEQELEDLYKFLKPYYENGLDAVIVQDFGVLRYLRRQFPKLDIHASTQMTNQGADGAKYLESLGVKRVVTSRELSLSEIQKIHRETDLEIESFVHGALCYSYSGQCLLSSVIGGRSGNRGRCAQPCRLPYRFSKKCKNAGEYLLSPKDICTLEILPEILEAGVYSLKIEGRMKRPEYTAGVVRIYRKYLDRYRKYGAKGYQVEETDIEELMDLYNRGGFSTGYYKTHGSAAMMSTYRQNHFGTEAGKILSAQKNILTVKALENLNKGDVLESATLSADVKKNAVFSMKLGKGMESTPGKILHRTQNAKLLQELAQYQALDFHKEKINGKLIIFREKPAILSLSYKEVEVSVEGAVVQKARSTALTPDSVEKQVRKTGATAFEFENLEIQMEEGCFLPVQALKELRRQGIEALTEKILNGSRREKAARQSVAKFSGRSDEGFYMSALAFSYEQAEALMQVSDINRIYLEAGLLMEDPERFVNAVRDIQAKGQQCFLAMPYLFREETKKIFLREDIRKALQGADGFLVRNLEEMVFLKERALQPMIADTSLYTYNQEARSFLREAGFSADTAPLELNDRELLKRGMAESELLVYGRIPLMISAQCLKRTGGNCDRKKEFQILKDRKGMEFPVWNDCSLCCNLLFNTLPHSLWDNEKEISQLRPSGLRLSFTVESGEETFRIARGFADRFCKGQDRGLNLREFTRGHFKRGVE